LNIVEPQKGDANSDEPVKSITFNPEFTYPIFGEHETAFGYQDLSIKVRRSYTKYHALHHQKKKTNTMIA
jgi:histone acetyltransferase 1